MSSAKQLAAGAVSVTLIVIYSWIMTSSNGTASSWAWLLLVAGLVFMAIAARSATRDRGVRRDD